MEVEIPLTLTKGATTLTQYEYEEYVDRKMLVRLLKSPLVGGSEDKHWMEAYWHGSEQQHLKRHKNRVRAGENRMKVSVQRSGSIGFARVYAKQHFSLACLRGVVRRTICFVGTYKDLDVEHCHATILRQICAANGILCPALDRNCEDREGCLDEVKAMFVEGTPKPRKKAKGLFLRLMFGGTVCGFKKKNAAYLREGVPVPECATDMEDELKCIAKVLWGANPEMVASIQKVWEKKGKTDNLLGSFLSYYLQEWERRVLEAAFNGLMEAGYIGTSASGAKRCVLCYDGIMVEVSVDVADTEVKDMLLVCQNAVREALGFSLTFTEKSMDEDTLMPELEAWEKKQAELAFPPEKCFHLDTDYMKRELGTYEIKKRYVEQFIVKVESPQTCYVETYTKRRENKHGEMVHEVCSRQHGRHELADMLSHVGSGEYTKFGTERPFTDVWLGPGGGIKTFKFAHHIPYNGVLNHANRTADPNSYNLFQGYDSRIETPLTEAENSDEFRARMLHIYMDIGLNLCEGKQNVFDFLMRCIAWKIQNPTEKLHISPIVKGNQGVGKSLWFGVLPHVVGAAHYIESANPADFFGTHAEGFFRKQFVVLNESEIAKTCMFESLIKTAIRETSMIMNAKNQRPIKIDNNAFVVFLTNKRAVPIDVVSIDRVFLHMEATDKYLGPEYTRLVWAKIVRHFRSPKFIRILYDHLNGMDLSGFDAIGERKKALTESYWAAVRMNVPLPARFFADFVMGIRRWCDPDKGREVTNLNEEERKEYRRDMLNATPRDGELWWSKPIAFKRADLYEAFKDWGKRAHFFERKPVPSMTKFYTDTTNTLNLPICERNSHNHTTLWDFTPERVYAYLAEERRWVKPIGEPVKLSDAEVRKEDAKFVGAIINEIVQKAIFQAEVLDKFLSV